MNGGIKDYVGPATRSKLVNKIIYTITATYFGRDGRIEGIIYLGIPSNSIIGISQGDVRLTAALIKGSGLLVAQKPMHLAMLGKIIRIKDRPSNSQETKIMWLGGKLSIVSLKTLPDYDVDAVAAISFLSLLGPSTLFISAGFITLGFISVALLRLSALVECKSLEVEQALAKNKILFQEVHHRVKNNLQVISSLMHLQTNKLPEAHQPIMQEMADKIQAIGLVHEQIYSTNTPTVVQLDQFLRKLIEHLKISLLLKDDVSVIFNLEPMLLSLDRAVPVALLASEAFTNAVKYGLPDQGGAVEIALIKSETAVIFQISDNGSGIDRDRKAGLGTRIMDALGQQIGGVCRLEPRYPCGTNFILSWPT